MASSRLIHSRAGYLRYMQMSSETLFAFVEGKDVDPFFYGQICAKVCTSRGISYKLCKANELPPNAGGKTTLLKFCDYLRHKRSLTTTLCGKTTYAVFFVDKDIDDLTRRKRKTSYVIYTRYYDVHNEVFRHGDLVRGVASGASIDAQLIAALLSDPSRWCEQASKRWQEWLVLCLIVALRGLNFHCNYGLGSKIQCPQNGNVNPALLSQFKSSIATKLNLTTDTFQALYEATHIRVQNYFKKGQHDKIFKGKWYPFLLDEDVRRLMGTTDYMKNGFTKRITSSIAATLDFTSTWTGYYTTSLEKALDMA